MVGTGKGAQAGILIRSADPLAIVRDAAGIGIVMRTGEAFQTLRQVSTVVLDKTGTLTLGRPTVRGIHPHGMSEDELLAFEACGGGPCPPPHDRVHQPTDRTP
ncbi:hypothetical protein [Streptomyces sp. Inha503]|uniref:hypothetical protein n=1 Tax=Streptomyces sp. Inha503 TaxID=3383314 RepID=UPI0039A00CE3